MPVTYFGHRVIHLESIDSTNNYTAKVFKSGEVLPGSVIMADIQTNGRGQRDKTWQSGAYENLTFSLTANIKLWKINSLVDLNRLIALSLHSFFEELGLTPKIKWPNDIMINDKKVCGILIENFFKNTTPLSVIGIGINVNERNIDAPRATSIAEITGQDFLPKELLYRFIGNLNKTFNRVSIQDSVQIHRLYDALLWRKNEPKEFTLANEQSAVGIIQGTNQSGELEILINEEVKHYRNGEVKY
jgi:BirA family biotin operon repressor/biotin-[acetyl-CoA-carboxylase] ligase